MKRIGIIKEFNNTYGIIKTEDNIVDFDIKDFSCNEEIKIGDIVEFREEVKAPYLSVARNIKKIENKRQ